MATSVNAISGTDTSQNNGTSSTAKSNTDLTGKDTFLKLLVAQIKNQNPLNPADGVQFLTQLAQFSELEQLIQIRGDVGTLAANGQQTDPQTDGAGKTATT